MTRERAYEILASYGADAARWPADERAALLALAAADPEVARALAAEQSLDAMLVGWARDVPPRQFDPAALLPAPAATASGGRRGMVRWAAGAAVAASLALALIGLPPGGGQVEQAQETVVATALPADETVELEEGFAMFFTPTADEEDVI